MSDVCRLHAAVQVVCSVCTIWITIKLSLNFQWTYFFNFCPYAEACYTFPEIHLWCNTCRPLDDQHSFSHMRVSVNSNLRAARGWACFPQFVQNCSEHQILWSLCLVDIQTLHSVVLELQVLWVHLKTVKIPAKRAHPWHSPLVQHLLTSWRQAWRPVAFPTYVLQQTWTCLQPGCHHLCVWGSRRGALLF